MSHIEGSWFESQWGPFCVEFACCGFSCRSGVRLIGDSKLTVGVNVSVIGYLACETPVTRM